MAAYGFIALLTVCLAATAAAEASFSREEHRWISKEWTAMLKAKCPISADPECSDLSPQETLEALQNIRGKRKNANVVDKLIDLASVDSSVLKSKCVRSWMQDMTNIFKDGQREFPHALQRYMRYYMKAQLDQCMSPYNSRLDRALDNEDKRRLTSLSAGWSTSSDKAKYKGVLRFMLDEFGPYHMARRDFDGCVRDLVDWCGKVNSKLEPLVNTMPAFWSQLDGVRWIVEGHKMEFLTHYQRCEEIKCNEDEFSKQMATIFGTELGQIWDPKNWN